MTEKMQSAQDIYELGKKVIVVKKGLSEIPTDGMTLVLAEKMRSAQDVFGIGKKVILERVG